MEERKHYVPPELTIYGNVEELTTQGGGGFTDVPIGSPVINGDIDSVIGSGP